jgi:hypothetical protein
MVVARWVLARLLDGAALLVAGWWRIRRELREGMTGADLDTDPAAVGRQPLGQGAGLGRAWAGRWGAEPPEPYRKLGAGRPESGCRPGAAGQEDVLALPAGTPAAATVGLPGAGAGLQLAVVDGEPAGLDE